MGWVGRDVKKLHKTDETLTTSVPFYLCFLKTETYLHIVFSPSHWGGSFKRAGGKREKEQLSPPSHPSPDFWFYTQILQPTQFYTGPNFPMSAGPSVSRRCTPLCQSCLFPTKYKYALRHVCTTVLYIRIGCQFLLPFERKQRRGEKAQTKQNRSQGLITMITPTVILKHDQLIWG